MAVSELFAIVANDIKPHQVSVFIVVTIRAYCVL